MNRNRKALNHHDDTFCTMIGFIVSELMRGNYDNQSFCVGQNSINEHR